VFDIRVEIIMIGVLMLRFKTHNHQISRWPISETETFKVYY
jgi:hypothetical protein